MNRRKKIKQILTKKSKKANEKNLSKNKTKYISKADRAAADLERQETPDNEEAITLE